MGLNRTRQLLAAGVIAVAVPLVATGMPAAARVAGDSGVRDASSGGGSAQTEQTLAVDPTDANNVLVGFISGVSVSHDGGLTWHRASVTCGGDNNPAFDRNGVAYFECDNNGVEFYRSVDKGDTWTGPFSAVGFFE